MTTPEIELQDGVWDKAMAAKESVRYVDHPDNHQAVYGMSRYAVRAMLAAAFAAGRESLPWLYAVKDRHGDELHHFGYDLEGALNYAAPVDGYPQLTVLRWRQGPLETAVIPDVNA